MAEDNKTTNDASKVAAAVAKDIYGGDRQKRQRGGRPPRRDNRRRDDQRDEFEQRILEIARVTRVMAGGKRMNFRACVAIGDRKGSVGVGLGKGADVTMAVNKAVNRAKKVMIKVPVVNETIPHVVHQKVGAASIIFKPAKQGRGVIAGGVARAILELAGIKNVTSKVLGTNNKINNARCTIAALSSLRVAEKKAPKAKAEEPKAAPTEEAPKAEKAKVVKKTAVKK
ncbi:MAG: ribosomal protein S5 [Bacillota bacterium]